METPKVSIIIPVYNVEAYLDQCIQSVVSQSLREIEIIIINDGSTDKSGDIIMQYTAMDNRIKAIYQENKGIFAARNRGLDEVTGQYIAFIDSDDWISNDALETLYNMAETEQADVVAGNTMRYYENDNHIFPWREFGPYFENKKHFTGKDFYSQTVLRNCYTVLIYSYLYKSNLIKKHQIHFEPTLHEDELWMPIVLFYAQKVTYVNCNFYFYRQQRLGSFMDSTAMSKRLSAYQYVAERLIDFLFERYKENRFNTSECLYLCCVLRSFFAIYDTIQNYHIKIPLINHFEKIAIMLNSMTNNQRKGGLKYYYALLEAHKKYTTHIQSYSWG